MTDASASLRPVVDALLRAHAGGPAADDGAALPLVSSLEEAYAVQEQLYAALVPGSASTVAPYWKSGGPTRADPMRHAPLPPAGVRSSPCDARELPLRNRWIEAEVALRLGRDVTPAHAERITPHDAHAVVDAIAVSIELVDTRWASGRAAAPLLKVADLVVHGALVLGGFVPFAARRWEEQECRVRIGGGEWRVFHGSLGVGDPAWVLPAWLRHVTRHGATAPAGTVVSTGTWCGLLDAAPGERVDVEFPGIGAAAVQF